MEASMSRDAVAATKYLRDYAPPAFLIDEAELYFDLREAGTRVRSRLHIRRNPDGPASEALRLDGEGLEPVRVAMDDLDLPPEAWRVEEGDLVIADVPGAFVLDTEVEIHPEANTALEGLYRSGGMYCTQCEAEGFRRITWFLDRPDVMTRFRVTLEADRERFPVLLSNGNPGALEAIAGGRHRATWIDPFPKPSYLFALVAGDLGHIADTFTTLSGRTVDLRIYTDAEDPGHCRHAMASLRNAMRWDEEHYGREYDLDVYNVVAVGDFNMGAMENKGLNIFNAKYVLASPETATDDDYQHVEGVIGHEYFHNWTGNRITCRDWFQLSLKEGLTVFRDQEFSADMGSRGVKRIRDVRFLRAHQFAEDAGPMAHPVRPESYIEINNFYTLTVYEKGAELVRMQHNLLGPAVFRRAMDLYFERHDGEAVTTDDFVRCMEDASGRDLGQFRRWYDQAGTPVVSVDSDYDPEEGVFELVMRQRGGLPSSEKDYLPTHIPVAVGLLDPEGNDLPLFLEGAPPGTGGMATVVLELTQAEQRFRFLQVPQRPVPSLLRGFSAPVKLEHECSDGDLQFRMAQDSDGFCRWDAAQRLHERVLLARVRGEGDTLTDGYVDAFAKALTDGETDRALLAEILTLPSESYLGDSMDTVDVDAIHAAREGLMAALAARLRADLQAVHAANAGAGEYSIAPQAMAARALRNTVLAYLARLGDDESRALCVHQYHAAGNMTDVLAALARVAHSDWRERDELLADFHDRWRHDPLVLDKWFALQATSPRPDALARVTALMDHPGFSLANPNRVRALVGSFVAGNPVRFHAKDGSGYRFLADIVLQLDAINPQTAARLLRHMSRWRRHDAQRQALMAGELRRVLAQGGLSPDTYEVASRSMAPDRKETA
jgi:aminopeptidase N